MNLILLGDKLSLYLHDNSDNDYIKVVFDRFDFRVISEEPLNMTPNTPLPHKSKSDIVIGQDIVSDTSWEIILWPLEKPEQFYPLKQFTGTRYDFPASIWSISGEYFMLLNRDALGMNRFESFADLLAYPKDEWPTALQYDVFRKDGSFAFSFPVDSLYKEDGSESNFDLFWIAGDQIYISSTFYDATLD